MRGVAEEKYSAMAQPVEQALMEPVVTEPHQFIGDVTEQTSDPTLQSRRAAVRGDVADFAQLPVDAPHPLRLGMDQDRGTRVRGMVKEKPGLGGEGQLCADVGDQEPVRVRASPKLQAEQLA